MTRPGTGEAVSLLAALLLSAIPAAAAGGEDGAAPPADEVRIVERAAAADGEAAAVQPPWGSRRTPTGPGPVRARRDPRFALTLYSGYRALDTDSALFEENGYDFGMTERDFLSARYGMEFEWMPAPRIALVLGAQTAGRDVISSYVDLVYEDGGEIEHFTSLNLTDLTLGLRIRFGSAGARLQPYLAGGAGLLIYSYTENGDFVDFATSDIYYDEYRERQPMFSYYAGGGLDFEVARMRDGAGVSLFAEFRLSGSQGTHEDDFEGFSDFSLYRMGVLAGLRVQF